MRDLEKRFPIYSKALTLYPPAYRERYDEQMLQTLADMLDAQPSPARRIATWARVLLDLPVNIFQQQLSFASHTLAHETPRYVRRNSFISVLLFAPFFALVITNDMTAHGLYHTWLWSVNVLLAWIIILPAAGLTLSALTFLLWLYDSRKKEHRTWLQGLRDFRHSWPMLALVIVGLGILSLVLFHDSVHCVAGNPVRELHNPSQTLRCIRRG